MRIDLNQALEVLDQSDVVAVPTETVYGLASNGYADRAVERIYRVKGRPIHNPLIMHYCHPDAAEDDVIWTPAAKALAQAFWPGPLTLVLARHPQSRISMLATAGLASVAIRVPAHPVFAELLKRCPYPLAAPSANPSGRLSPTHADHVLAFFKGTIPVIDGGPCQYGIESTIVDCRQFPRILRPGALLDEDICAVLGIQALEYFSEEGVAPGALKAHYAPTKPLRLNAVTVGPDEGLLAWGQPLPGAMVTVSLSPTGDLREAAQTLFQGLYELDCSPCRQIAVMPLPNQGLGQAIHDRLQRAAAAFENSD